jgi:hypothetical protein
MPNRFRRLRAARAGKVLVGNGGHLSAELRCFLNFCTGRALNGARANLDLITHPYIYGS